jgi:hypothetical protein
MIFFLKNNSSRFFDGTNSHQNFLKGYFKHEMAHQKLLKAHFKKNAISETSERVFPRRNDTSKYKYHDQ